MTFEWIGDPLLIVLGLDLLMSQATASVIVSLVFVNSFLICEVGWCFIPFPIIVCPFVALAILDGTHFQDGREVPLVGWSPWLLSSVTLSFLVRGGARLGRTLLPRRHLFWLRDSVCYLYGLEDGIVSSCGLFLVVLVSLLVVCLCRFGCLFSVCSS